MTDQLAWAPPCIAADRLAAGPSGCVIWTGPIINGGYGVTRSEPGGPKLLVHRLVYEHAHGPVPPGLLVGHVCHDRDISCPGGPCLHRRCANPHHLKAMTPRENNLGGRLGDVQRARFAAITHCPQGHPYDEVNTYRAPRTGQRACKACGPARWQRYQAKRKSRAQEGASA